MRKPIGLILLVTVVLGILELFVIARWKTGVFDPRCLFLKSYILAHSYAHGQEAIRCVRDTP